MKKQALVLLLFFISVVAFGQSKSIVITVKTTVEQMSEKAQTELIIVDENNQSIVKSLPSLLSETEGHEKIIQEEVNKVTAKGFKLVNSSSLQYGGIKGRYYLITRYIFTESGK